LRRRESRPLFAPEKKKRSGEEKSALHVNGSEVTRPRLAPKRRRQSLTARSTACDAPGAMSATGGGRGAGSGPPGQGERALAAYVPALRAAARTLCRSDAECQDLVQDTLERALRYLRAKHDRVRNMRAWLITILRNVFTDRLRKHRTTVSVDDCEAPAPDPQPVWANVTPEDVQAACATIDPLLRKVFELRYLQEKTYREIAIELDIPVNTVGSRLYRARKALEERLLAKLGGDAP
jgi:RNA polymerase sigma-70 factor, ECF subfamily